MDVFSKLATQLAALFMTLITACVGIGCHNSRGARPAPVQVRTPPPYVAPAPARMVEKITVAQQFEHGQRIYVNHCAACHGDAGQGTDMAPPLVGAGALPLYPRPGSKRPGSFHTAMDVATFVTQAMPPDETIRAQFREQDYWAVLGFALKANGVELSEPVGPNTAAGIVLHP